MSRWRDETIGECQPIFTGASPAECWPLVRDFHYSRRMPSNIQHSYVIREPGGLFGDFGKPIAAGIFTIPGTRWSEEVIELARLVRNPRCAIPLSSLIAFSCLQLRRKGWLLAVSFADRSFRHHGGIYQAAGWNYAGLRKPAMDGLVIDGRFYSGRSCNSKWGTRSPERLAEKLTSKTVTPHFDEGKHLYWRALCVAGKTRAKRLSLSSLPYPKEFAARPSDESVPADLSEVQPFGAAPNTDHMFRDAPRRKPVQEAMPI